MLFFYIYTCIRIHIYISIDMGTCSGGLLLFIYIHTNICIYISV